MKIPKIRKENKFIPEFNGNQELPSGEQIVVNIKTFPSAIEAKQYKSYRIGAGGSIEIAYPKDAVLLKKHVGGISNLDAEGENINNGSTLADTNNLFLGDLISEIRDYLLEVSEPIDPGES